jgi:hypothetical protein
MAGTTAQCAWCKQAFRVPTLSELPPDKLAELKEEHARAAAKQKQQEERARRQSELALQRQNEQQQREEQKAVLESQARAAAAKKQAAVAGLSDNPNVELVASILESVQRICTSQERVEYIAIQEKPLVNVMPDAAVATNRRLIFYRRKLLGRASFEDYLWRDLGNAHLQQGVLSSTFSAQHMSGRVVSMTHIPKDAAQKLYRIAQEREEEAIEFRRQRAMEESRAAAASVNVHTPQVAAVPAATAPHNDPVERLAKLKAMLDQGLISQEDYDRRKQEILSQL